MSTTKEIPHVEDTEVIEEEEISPATAEFEPSPQTDVPVSTPEVRIRTLTERGKETYAQKRDKFCRDLNKQWSILEKCLKKQGPPRNIEKP